MKLRVWDYAKGVYDDRAFTPAKPGDAGIDLRAAESLTVHAAQTVAIPLGISIEIPGGCVGWLTGRSSTALGRSLLTHEGKIDSGYRGELHCLVTALGSPVQVQKGDRICQLLVLSCLNLEDYGWQVVDELDPSERGADGLGSTGLQ